MGAGDVKFMGAVGAIVGPALVVSAFLFTAIAGGVLAIAVAIRRQRLGATIAGTGRLISAPGDAKKEIHVRARNRIAVYFILCGQDDTEALISMSGSSCICL